MALVVALVVALVGAACAGPVAPVEVGSKEVSLDLLLGAKVKKVAQAPVPPLALPVSPTGFVAFQPQPPPPAGERPTTTTVPPPPCPEADPLAVPKKVAPNAVTIAPKPGLFTARTTGRFRVGGANAQDVLLAPSSAVKVDNVVAEQPGTTAFDVTVTNGNASTTTTYRLLPTGANVPFPTGVSPVFAGVPPQTTPPGEAPRPTGVPPGLYLARVASPGAVAFTPPFPGLVMARFPLDLGSSFDAAASDGATSMSWRSTVKAKATVDACGTPLDAYQIELANGRSTTANGAENVTFTSTLMMGTQYGGLLLAQSTSAIGTQGAVGVSRDVSITLDQEPQT